MGLLIPINRSLTALFSPVQVPCAGAADQQPGVCRGLEMSPGVPYESGAEMLRLVGLQLRSSLGLPVVGLLRRIRLGLPASRRAGLICKY